MKAIKKALALCLALAMVVTAVPVSTADAAVKTAKLSKSSVTVAGNATKKQTKSVKVTTNADWKNVKVTASSADKKVATVKVSKKTVKVTAVKKGETKVTVKVTGKKSGKNVSKKLTLKVTVCGAGLAVKAPAELTVGDTTKLAVKTTPSTASCTFDVDKAEVATVSDNGTITAVAPGTAKVVVRTDYGKEKTVTVTVKEAKKDLSITAEATKADTITITANKDLAADTKVTVTKKGVTTAVDGKAEISGSTITYKGTANFAKGDYTVEVVEGDVKASAEVSFVAQYVKEIIIKSTTALTGKSTGGVDGDTAYIYYDVVDQYGESVRNTANITWTTTAGKPKDEKSIGKLTMVNAKSDGKTVAFTFGSEITVVGVYTKTGVSKQATVKIGMPQALDKVEAIGFVDTNNPSELLSTLPNDFGKASYVMVYNAYDQEGQILPADMYLNTAADPAKSTQVTFISGDPLMVENDFTDHAVVTVKGVEYSAVNIKPGKYADKGGVFTIDAIANKTGTKTPSTFTIGSNGLLKQLELLGPSATVADGDGGVVINYVATTTDGTETVDYETIVRSSNALQLNATDGTLTISEGNDGSAIIKWSDDAKYTKWATAPADAMDGIDRTVVFTTIVVGGDSSNYQMSVSDKRIPVAIKEVKVNEGADAIVVGDVQYLGFFKEAWGNVTYVDQYNCEMHTHKNGDVTKWNTWAPDFFNNFQYTSGRKYGNFEKNYYGIKVDYVAKNHFMKYDYSDAAADEVFVPSYSDSYSLTTKKDGALTSVVSDTVKYTIVTTEDASGDVEKYSDAGKTLTATYDLVPTEKLASLTLKKFNTLHMDTYANAAGTKNGLDAGMQVSTVSGSALKDIYSPEADSMNVPETKLVNSAYQSRLVKVSGLYKGKSLQIHSDYVALKAGSKFTVVGGNLDTVKADSLKWSDLYDVNSPVLARKNATLPLEVEVKSPYQIAQSKSPAVVTTDITLSDAPSRMENAYLQKGDKPTLLPSNTGFDVTDGGHDKWNTLHVCVQDQYGDNYESHATLTYTVSDYVENTGKFAHVLNNAVFADNGSALVKATGLEIGDTFKVTVKVVDKKDSSNVKTLTADVTMGADLKASVSSGIDTKDQDDYKLRTGKLNYVR